MVIHTNLEEPIIIVGSGVSGLSTTLALLRRGYKNLHLFDKNDYLVQDFDYFKGCDSPSSDMNKIFRAAYGEQAHYQKMALASRDILLQWNREIKECNFEGGDPIYLNSGNIHLTDQIELPVFEKETVKNMGPKRAITISDHDAADRCVHAGLDVTAVDPFGMKRRGHHLQGVLDVTGGMIRADKCCRWVLHLCRKEGANRLTLHMGQYSGELQELLHEYDSKTGKNKCIGVKTKDGNLHFAPLIITALGPWTVQAVPEAAEKLEATGGTVALIKMDNPTAAAKYSEDVFPTWTYKVRDGAMGGLYGFPVRHNYMKIGYRGLKWTNPSPTVSHVKTAYTEQAETNVPLFGLELIKNFIRQHIPEVSHISKTRLCWYSDTEDNDFLVSYSPYHADHSLFTIAGDSGHLFMMFGSVGETIADIITQSNRNSETMFLENLFSWTRVREKLNIIGTGKADPRALCNMKMATESDWIVRETSKL